jgi:hypothetical protein
LKEVVKRQIDVEEVEFFGMESEAYGHVKAIINNFQRIWGEGGF